VQSRRLNTAAKPAAAPGAAIKIDVWPEPIAATVRCGAMGRVRGIGIAGVIALMAVPATALAESLERPAAGAWVPYATQNSEQSDVAFANFTVVGSGVTSLTLAVTDQSGENPGCPTGSVSVPGPLEIKRYKFPGSRAFLGFGRVVHDNAVEGHKKFEDAPVTATLDGQPIKGAKFSIQFVPADTEGVTGDLSGGGFDFSAKCQVSLSEDISQAQNTGSS
jgi:hypothetical protein